MSQPERVISKRGKKVCKWGPGLAVLITRECRRIGWTSNTFLRVIVLDTKDGKKIVLEEMGNV